MGEKIVFTCGCFDIIHAGHIKYLKEAGKLGYLVVGITNDENVRKLKGENRPIIDENQRLELIRALSFVKQAFIGTDIDFSEYILKTKPDYYVKGGDYNINTINQKERRAVESYGGKIRFLSFIKGLSTTRIIQKIKE